MASKLKIRFVHTRPVYTDVDTGATLSVAIYEPQLPETGDWYFLGHMAIPLPQGKFYFGNELLEVRAPLGMIVQSDDPNALRPVQYDQLLHTDHKSKGTYNLRLHSLKTDSGYQALGLYAENQNPKNPNHDISKLRAVRDDLLAEIPPQAEWELIYNDAKSGARDGSGIWDHVSFWQIPWIPGLISPRTFFATGSYSKQPQGKRVPESVYALAGTSIEIEGAYARWMETTPEIEHKKLQHICLPATHDSGTYQLIHHMIEDPGTLSDEGMEILNTVKSIADKIDNIPGIGKFIPDPFSWVANSVFPAILAVSTAQNRSIGQQLADGIRGFDLRVYHYNNDFHVGHGGILGPSLTKTIFMEIREFLDATAGEIIYITLGGWTAFPKDQAAKDKTYQAFAKTIVNILGEEHVLRCESQSEDLFGKTYAEIVGAEKKSKVILVWDSWPMPDYIANTHHFWRQTFGPPAGGITSGIPDAEQENVAKLSANLPGIYGSYTDTEDRQKMTAQQWKQYELAAAQKWPFALYTTLTPQATSTVMLILQSAKSAIFKLSWMLIPIPVLGIILSTALKGVALGLAISEAAIPHWRSLYELEKVALGDFFKNFVSRFTSQPGSNYVSLIYTDFYQETNVVETAIALSKKAVEQPAPQPVPQPTPQPVHSIRVEAPADPFYNLVYQLTSEKFNNRPVYRGQVPDGRYVYIFCWQPGNPVTNDQWVLQLGHPGEVGWQAFVGGVGADPLSAQWGNNTKMTLVS